MAPTGRRTLAIHKYTIPDGALDIGEVEVRCEPSQAFRCIADPIEACAWPQVVDQALSEATEAGGDGIYDIRPPRPPTHLGASDAVYLITARVFRFPGPGKAPVSEPPLKRWPLSKKEQKDSDF